MKFRGKIPFPYYLLFAVGLPEQPLIAELMRLGQVVEAGCLPTGANGSTGRERQFFKLYGGGGSGHGEDAVVVVPCFVQFLF